MSLTDAEIGKCYRFAYEVTKRTDAYYKQRNQYASTEKLISDSFIAKMAELAVFHHLVKNDYTCSYPDFSIKDNEKAPDERLLKYSNDSDLIVFKNGKELKIHIKCCRFDSPVKESWLIQENNKTVTDPEENEFFALCVFYSPDNIVMKKMVEAKKVKWKETRNKLSSKKACYLNDLYKDT